MGWPAIAAHVGENDSTLRNRLSRARRRKRNAAPAVPTPVPADAGRVGIAQADGVTTYEVAGARTLAELAEACVSTSRR